MVLNTGYLGGILEGNCGALSIRVGPCGTTSKNNIGA